MTSQHNLSAHLEEVEAEREEVKRGLEQLQRALYNLQHGMRTHNVFFGFNLKKYVSPLLT